MLEFVVVPAQGPVPTPSPAAGGGSGGLPDQDTPDPATADPATAHPQTRPETASSAAIPMAAARPGAGRRGRATVSPLPPTQSEPATTASFSTAGWVDDDGVVEADGHAAGGSTRAAGGGPGNDAAGRSGHQPTGHSADDDGGGSGGTPNEVIARVERASGMLASQAVARMAEELPWFPEMSARHRADIQLVVQAGISTFVEWCRRPEHARELSGNVFRVAPRELVRAVTFRRLVDLVRVAVEAIEAEVPALAGPEHEQRLLADVLRYSRDIAFAGAVVYARAAEERGAWDARLEALVVDHVVRGEVDRALPSRAAAVGWRPTPAVTVVVGAAPPNSPEVVIDEVHRLARGVGLEVLAGVHHDRLVMIVGGDFRPDDGDGMGAVPRGPDDRSAPTPFERGTALGAARALLPACGPGPVVVGPVVGDLTSAPHCARAALAAADVVTAWPAAPRPVPARALLPELALAGDAEARRTLIEKVYVPLRDAGTPLLETAGAYLDFGASLEATARALYLHPNTVRYRLRKAADVCGLDPADHRERFILHIALVLGRLDGA